MYSTVHIVYTLQIFSGQWAVGHQYQLSDSVIVETVMQVFYMKIWFSQPYSDSPYTNSEAYSGIIKVPLHNKDSGRQKENLKAILSVIYRQDNSISRAGILWPLKPVVVVAASQATIVDILSIFWNTNWRMWCVQLLFYRICQIFRNLSFTTQSNNFVCLVNIC